MTIATMMRVKNEEKYLKFALESLKALKSPIFLLDDGSTDRTPEICEAFTGELYYQRQDGLPMDEGRDRTNLYKAAQICEPDWMFTLDGDEVLDPSTAARMLAAAEKCPAEVNVFEMYLAVMQSAPGAQIPMWLGGMEPQGAWSMDRMFRVRDADWDHEFVSNFSNNLHCGCTPKMEPYKKEVLNAWIRYYGYEDDAAVERKRAFYEANNPVDFPAVERLLESRKKLPIVNFPANPDCREMGKFGTVLY